eukprot:m.204790 g.204790  ORF g.204790 m.204790 type:complete len:89 (+) comp39653_c1_seq2:1764-2030(+)
MTLSGSVMKVAIDCVGEASGDDKENVRIEGKAVASGPCLSSVRSDVFVDFCWATSGREPLTLKDLCPTSSLSVEVTPMKLHSQFSPHD